VRWKAARDVRICEHESEYDEIKMPLESAGAFAGATGVGAICFLAMFLILDGREPGVFPTVEFYAKTATWGIVAAVPVAAMAYVAGLLAIAVSSGLLEQVAHTTVGRSAIDSVALAQISKDSPVAQQYLQLRQEQGILAGSAIAMLLLTIGALSERRNLPAIQAATWWAVALGLVAGFLCFYVAFTKARDAHTIAMGVHSAIAASMPQAPCGK
jgi:hypothetical protein